MRLYPVFSRRIMIELEKQGFQVKQIAPNRHKPEYRVYYFEETVEFRNAIQQLMLQKKQ